MQCLAACSAFGSMQCLTASLKEDAVLLGSEDAALPGSATPRGGLDHAAVRRAATPPMEDAMALERPLPIPKPAWSDELPPPRRGAAGESMDPLEVLGCGELPIPWKEASVPACGRWVGLWKVDELLSPSRQEPVPPDWFELSMREEQREPQA